MASLVVIETDENGIQKQREPTIRECLKYILKLREKEGSTSERLSLYPIRDPEMFDFWTRQRAAMWVATEVSFKDDYSYFCQLKPEEQAPLRNTLLFFQVVDASVIEGPVLRWMLESKTIEEAMVYIAQCAEEAEHVESYALQIKAIIPDQIELKELVKKIDQTGWIHDYKEFLDKYAVEEDNPLPVALASQAIMEGAGFQQFFSVIFWYTDCPYVHDIPGITTSNELISIAEAIHADVAIFRFNREMQALIDAGIDVSAIREKVLTLFDEMEDITRRSLQFIIPEDIYDLTKENVLNYSINILEKIKVRMGFKSTRTVVNKLKYMERAGGEGKGNFYERDITRYARGQTRINDDDADDF